MKMCQEYWYDHSLAVVDRKNALNYVNHKTNERDTPKSPQKLVTLIETVARPGGLFLLDGVPISRVERPNRIEKSNSTTDSNNELILRHFPQSPVGLKTAEMQRRRELLNSSSLGNHGRASSVGHIRDLSYKPFPIWDKYYNRFQTPKNEYVQQFRRLDREDVVDKMRHVYWDDSFLQAPVENDAAATFTRLYLPSERSIERVRRRTGGAALPPTSVLEKQSISAVADVTSKQTMMTAVPSKVSTNRKSNDLKKQPTINHK